MTGRTAHILDKKWRSDDIKSGEDVEFSSFFLPKELKRGLELAGFKYLSPIQLQAIPPGNIGKDLIVQAKSGTGKTIVFTVVALNMLLKEATHPQVLVMAPTREIAFQISQVFQSVGRKYKGFRCDYFIGGRRMEEDVPRIQGCQVIVGTPGRIKQLINYKVLKTSGIRLFVLDEADQLLKESSFATDIDDIFRALPKDKQVIATSATYPPKLKRLEDKYFRDPSIIELNKNNIGLLGMVHYNHIIPVSNLPVVAYKEKLKIMENVLLSVKFAQCLVFCNMVSRVENLCFEIKQWGFATSYISSARDQEDRLKAIEQLKKFKCKVLVSSDVSSRGIDAENVDLVINFDLPKQLDIYFHRVGRAGRYGSKCASVTFITSDEIVAYEQMQTDGNFVSYPLPDVVPENLITLHMKQSVPNEEKSSGRESSSDKENCIENGTVKMSNEKMSSSSEILAVQDENVLQIKKSKNEESCENNRFIEKKSDEENSVTSEEDSSSEIVSVENENVLQVNKSEESCNNNRLIEKKLDLENSVTLEEENSEHCQSKSCKLASNILELQQINDASSDVILDNEAKTTDIKSFVMNNEINNSKNFKNPKSKDFFSSIATYIQQYENCNKDSGELSVDCIKSSQSNDNKFSLESLKNYRSSLSKYHYNVRKNFFGSLQTEDLINEIVQGYESIDAAEAEKQTNLIQNAENKIGNSSLDSELMVFSTPKPGTRSSVKSDDSSGLESSSGSDKDKLIEHFNLRLSSIRKVKPSTNQNSTTESSSGSESNSDTSVNSEDAMDMLAKEFNKVSQEKAKCFNKKAAHIVNHAELSSSSSSNSDSSMSIDSGKSMEELEHKFSKLIKTKRSNGGPCKDTEETKNILRKIQSTKKCYKNIKIVDTKKPAESSTSTSSDSDTSTDSEEETERNQNTKKFCKSIGIIETKKHAESLTSTSSDSDTSIDNGKVKDEPKKEVNKRMENVKNKVFIARKSSESSYCKSKTESEVDQFSKETSGLREGQDKKSCKKSKPASNTDSSYRKKTINRHPGNRISYYDSRTSAIDTESDIDQSSKQYVQPNFKVDHQSKRRNHKKDETVPKTGQYPFYSHTNGISNPCFNPESGRPTNCPPHSSYEMQPPHSASNPYNRQYSQQRQNNADEGSSGVRHSNYPIQPDYSMCPYYPSYSQQIQNHGNGQFFGAQSSHPHIQPTYVPNRLSYPYPCECPLMESCQVRRYNHATNGHTVSCSTSQRNSNPSTNELLSHLMQPSQYPYQCAKPSQHICHLPNETCQSPACAAWYDIFYKQWQFLNQAPYF